MTMFQYHFFSHGIYSTSLHFNRNVIAKLSMVASQDVTGLQSHTTSVLEYHQGSQRSRSQQFKTKFEETKSQCQIVKNTFFLKFIQTF